MYEYVDTVHAHSPAGYMTGMGDGVTHGGDWYVVYGSRQDYFNYYKSCREFTLELSNQKLLNPEALPAHWNYNYRSFLNYIRQSTYGVHGTVYDNDSGDPLLAEIYIPGHDSDNSEVATALPHGNYNRPLLQGSYDMQFSADNYDAVTITGVEAFNYQTTKINIGLGDHVSDDIVEVIIALEGDGGSVYPYTGTEYFNDGANVFLKAIDEAGWTFTKWVIGDESYYSAEVTYALDEDIDITAHFISDDSVIALDLEDFSPLLSVYPNPVEQHSKVATQMKVTMHDVSLALYDLYGKRIALLHQGTLTAGEHTFELSPYYSQMRPGFYLLILKTGEGMLSERIIRL